MTAPAPGSLVRVRGQRWVVGPSEGGDDALVELSSIEDGRYGETLQVIWSVETDAAVIDVGSLPPPTDFDPPDAVAAFLDAARWSTATSADVHHLQAPFRAGVSIEDYQLEPLARALVAPRVNLLLADDVGLGKTIEAGLVVLELLLRHRARSVLVVCPAGLTTKWRDEMAEKFGLNFTNVDAEECARLRRVRGSAANPFRSHPLAIVSLPWLRTTRAQRLLNEVLPVDVDPQRRTFDLLIVDEAHHVAPAAPKQRYAVDSQQTKLIKRLAPHCEHRLFLSATPHNGYPESFAALLELIDDQRFNRAAPIDPVAQRETIVRRLKSDVVEAGGESFPRRVTGVIEVDYPGADRVGYELLAELVEHRRRRRRGGRRGHRTDVVALLLKKRLYSSPAAFAATVDVVRGVAGRAPTVEETDDAWAEEFLDEWEDLDILDDEERTATEDAALRRAETEITPEPTDDGIERDLLDRMATWAAPYAHRADAKAEALLGYLEGICRPDGKHWLNERVVVFTEYRDTQTWLEDLMRRRGLTLDHRVALLHGGVGPDERERLRQEFMADPGQTKVRILLATDAAAEGIDLHWHCHRLVNYDIPFNPNRLEQRIGRIDRYGQRFSPEVRHFVGTGWQHRRTGFDADQDFLYRIATKISRVEADLGSANPVLASAVQQAMLGRPVNLAALDQPRRTRVASDAAVREQVARLRAQLDQTVADLQITPDRMHRLTSTALRLARQAPLTRAVDPDPTWDVPPLTGTWVRAADRLAHPLRPDQQRPITFDPAVARRRREDVVYAHLNHPLLAMAVRLMTAASAAGQQQLSRVTAVTTDRPEVSEPLVVAYARFLVIGGDAVRLHEEVLHAGGWVRGGRFSRLENLGLLGSVTVDALAAEQPVTSAQQLQIAQVWPDLESGLAAALDWRVRSRRDQVQRAVDGRARAEHDRLRSNFARFADTLRQQLAEPDQDVLPLEDPTEAAQAERDRAGLTTRLEQLPVEQAAEAARVSARYADLTDHTFPLAVVFVFPHQPPEPIEGIR